MKNPPHQFIEALNEVQQDFVWNKSRPKIKHASLIGNNEEGGYKDVDISMKLIALKITWIRRLHGWQQLSMENYPNLFKFLQAASRSLD